jgi:hypothetical protein
MYINQAFAKLLARIGARNIEISRMESRTKLQKIAIRESWCVIRDSGFVICGGLHSL